MSAALALGVASYRVTDGHTGAVVKTFGARRRSAYAHAEKLNRIYGSYRYVAEMILLPGGVVS